MDIRNEYVYTRLDPVMPWRKQAEPTGVTTRLQAVSDGVIRVTRTRRSEFLNVPSPVVVYQGCGEGDLLCEGEAAAFKVGEVAVKVSAGSGALTFLNTKGEVLLREPERRPYTLLEKPVFLNRFDPDGEIREERSIDGARAYAKPSETYQDRTAYECSQQFVFDKTEGLYGLGSHEEGYGNLRGRTQVLYQHNMKAMVPVLVSTKGWGLLLDMGCLMSFHDDTTRSSVWAECADELDWYFFYGDGSYASLMKQYRLLTGESPMLPKYSLGYIQSKERYKDAKEILEVAGEYRKRQVPLDVMVLDWQSWPEGQWGWKTFDLNRFPDPAKFIGDLHDMDVKLMISIWPSMQGPDNQDRAEMLEKGFMLGNRLIYNAYEPEARKLYWKQADNLFQHGVDAWWCDCSEPFESDWHGPIKHEPHMRVLLNTEEAKRYLDPAKFTLYSLFHSQGIYEGQRKTTDAKRVCNLTRSSFAGQHRYATITWSGDVSANWDILRRHVPEGMNFCATGEPYWSADIGAFFPSGGRGAWFNDGDYDKGVDDLGYRELYVRWLQYGAFLPMMRSHGTGTPREIWRFGEKGDMFYDAIEDYIRLRYHLVPYLYTLMAQSNTDGIAMLRVPALVFPGDEKLRALDDQMMIGDSLLVKPVTHPMYYMPESEKIEELNDIVSVYLPAGYQWFDLYTGERYEGGRTIDVHAPINRIPTFVRSGSILPWAGEVQSTAELKDAALGLIVYPGQNACFTLYDDEGDGYGYEKGLSASIPCCWDEESRTLTVGERKGCYPGMPEKLQLCVCIAGQECQEAVYTGEKLTIQL